MSDQRRIRIWIGLVLWMFSFGQGGLSFQRTDFPVVGVGVEW